jgi:murein DD-endopeptidase MepM/ murein hydrolase activator NlpD
MPQTAKLKRHGFTLSDLPPLGEGGRAWQEGEARRVNHRWLYGTIITAITGGFLMGAAVWGSIEKGSTARTPAKLISVADIAKKETRVVERFSNTSRKADKLSPVSEAFVSAKQTTRVSSVMKVGDREVTRVKHYAKVNANLVLSSTDRANDVPAFNPVKLMAGDNVQLEASEDTSGDIAVTFRELSQAALEQATFIVPNTREVLEKVRETSNSLTTTNRTLAIGLNPFGFGDKAGATSIVDKTPLNKGANIQPPDRTLTAKEADTVVSLLLEGGAGRDDARSIAATFNRTGQDLTLKQGDRIRLTFAKNKAGGFQPARISLFVNEREQAVALADDGRYLTLDTSKQAVIARAKEANGEEEEEEGGLKLYNAIYETALKQEIPKKIIDEMIRIFTYDIDFNKAVQSGDSFDVVYGLEDEGERGDVLFATLTTDGETRKFYKFQAPDDASIDYYDEKGKSAKKFLIRKPMQDGVFRSGFGSRRHPIYGITRFHSGVDWSARTGTPIIAAGNGTVDLAKRQSGYGNRIELSHTNGYRTAYSHLSRYAKGIKEGARVTQGQIIGFVGSTGASTGPHLHYEVEVNGSYVDPLRVRVPRGREFSGAILAEFNKEVLRVDSIFNKRNGLKSASLN